MYTQFFNLNQKPFTLVPNPSFLYLSQEHKNALTYFEYGLSENIGFLLLTGEIGTGKTTLLRHILNRVGHDMEVAVLFNTNLSPNELTRLILDRFEVDCDVNLSQTRALEVLYGFLIEKYSQGKKVLLVIDEAQNLSKSALEEIRMLSNLQTDDEMLLKIMIVGQPELRQKIQSPGLEQFAQRIAASYHLSGMSLEETRDYISTRIEKAGGKDNPFTSAAIKQIFNFSNGIPRRINLICDASLVYGFADETVQIDKAIIRQVVAEKDGIGLLTNDVKNNHKEISSALTTSDNDSWQELFGQVADIGRQINSLDEKIEKILNQRGLNS